MPFVILFTLAGEPISLPVFSSFKPVVDVPFRDSTADQDAHVGSIRERQYWVPLALS